MVKDKTRRRKKFIDRDVQGTLVFRLALHWCVFLLVGMLVSLGLQYLSDPFRPAKDHLRLFAHNQAGFLLAMVCMTPIFLYDAVKMSHRFAGPILRVRRTLGDLACGKKVRPVTFRPGDFWTEIADNLNQVAQFVECLGERHEQDADAESVSSDAPVQNTLDNVGQA